MSWESIRGHDAIRDQFAAAVRQGRLGSSYLFVGPPGVGKQRVATELAMTLLCDSPPSAFAACDRCSSCRQVIAGTHPDVLRAQKDPDKLEFTIDVMKTLCASLGLKATRNGWKIAIVDEADDFNEEAANAFLKSLEEPPPRTLILLLATSSESVLTTIRSRCQVIRFGRVSTDDITTVLIEQQIEPQPSLVSLANGSVGRAIALHDEAVAAFRDELFQIITEAQPSAARLQARWTQFIEDAGKESVRQRERAAVAVSLLLDVISQAVRESLAMPLALDDPAQRERIGRLAKRLQLDGLLQVWETCLDAEHFIDRRVQLALLADLFAERLGTRVK